MELLYRRIGDFISYIGYIGDIGDTNTPEVDQLKISYQFVPLWTKNEVTRC